MIAVGLFLFSPLMTLFPQRLPGEYKNADWEKISFPENKKMQKFQARTLTLRRLRRTAEMTPKLPGSGWRSSNRFEIKIIYIFF